jgi:uncharacterized protein (TIGR02118 family)
MYEVVWFARLRRDRAREDMRRYWTETHGALGLRVAELRSYVQNHVVAGTRGGDARDVPFDGYSVHEYDDRSSFEAALASPIFAEIVEDGANVFEMESMDGMSAALERRVIRDGPRSPCKAVFLAKFRGDLARQEAAAHWRDVHGPLALEVPGIDRYVQHVAVAAIDGGGATDALPRFDGFSECWFADAGAFERAVASPEWARLAADGANFMDVDALRGMSALVEERVIC